MDDSGFSRRLAEYKRRANDLLWEFTGEFRSPAKLTSEQSRIVREAENALGYAVSKLTTL